MILTPTLGLCLTILKAQVKMFGINLDSDVKHEVSTNYKLKPKSNMQCNILLVKVLSVPRDQSTKYLHASLSGLQSQQVLIFHVCRTQIQ